ncbi:unnamed protein product [Boreogadus saida]
MPSRATAFPSGYVVPGQTFGPAALQALERSVQVDNRGASTSQHGLTSAVALRHGWHFRRQEHLSYWQEQTTDPWIVSTLFNGADASPQLSAGSRTHC